MCPGLHGTPGILRDLAEHLQVFQQALLPIGILAEDRRRLIGGSIALLFQPILIVVREVDAGSDVGVCSFSQLEGRRRHAVVQNRNHRGGQQGAKEQFQKGPRGPAVLRVAGFIPFAATHGRQGARPRPAQLCTAR